MLVFYVITECHILKQRINPGVHCESYSPPPNKEMNNTVANISPVNILNYFLPILALF
jgi:hypothetical protein